MYRCLTMFLASLLILAVVGCGGDSGTAVSSADSGAAAGGGSPGGGPPAPPTPPPSPTPKKTAPPSSAGGGGSGSAAAPKAAGSGSAEGGGSSQGQQFQHQQATGSGSAAGSGSPEPGGYASPGSGYQQGSGSAGGGGSSRGQQFQHQQATGGERESGSPEAGGYAPPGSGAPGAPTPGGYPGAGGAKTEMRGGEQQGEYPSPYAPGQGSGPAGEYPRQYSEGGPAKPGGYPGAKQEGYAGTPGRSGMPSRKMPPPKPEPPTLREQAVDAFRAGAGKIGFDYLLAAALVDDQSDVLDQYALSPALGRPTPSLRWGLGTEISVSPRIYEGSYYPIGTHQDGPRRDRGRGRGGRGGHGRGGSGGGSDYSSGTDMGPGEYGGEGYSGAPGADRQQADMEVITQVAGEFGEQFVARLKERIANGNYGEALPEITKAMREPRRKGRGTRSPYGRGSEAAASGYPAGTGSMPGGSGSAEYGSSYAEQPGASREPREYGSGSGSYPAQRERGSGSGAYAEQQEYGGSSGASPAREEYGGEYPESGSGGYGSGAPGGAAGTSRGPAGGGNGLGPGLVVLGEDQRENLLDKAADQGVDVLVFFEADVEQNRKTGLVINKTQIELWDVRSRDRIVATPALNNYKVQLHREENRRGEDPVEEALNELFAEIDQGSENERVETKLKVREFPESVRREYVEGHISELLDQEDVETLPKLAEIKFYHSHGLIDDATLTKCFQKALGETDGAKLAQGDKDERLKVVRKFLPETS